MVHFFHAPLADAAKYRKKHEEVRQIMSRINPTGSCFKLPAMMRSVGLDAYALGAAHYHRPGGQIELPDLLIRGVVFWHDPLKKDGKKIWKSPTLKIAQGRKMPSTRKRAGQKCIHTYRFRHDGP